MKLNKKGMTLIEIIVSVCMLSTIMIFMYNLLAQVSYEKDNEFFASRNQEQRIEIISYIENLISELQGDITFDTNGYLEDDNNKYQIYYENDYFKVDIVNNAYSRNTLRKWKLIGVFDVSSPVIIETTTEDTIVKYEIYTENTNNMKNNNNTIDDIEFTIIKK